MRFLLCAGVAMLAAAVFFVPVPVYELPALRLGEAPAPEARLIFGGDMMFDRYIRQVMQTVSGDYVFSCIDHALLEGDAVVANLEGPITDFDPVSIGTSVDDPRNYRFTFPPETASLLSRHNISVVNIGNNHILNFGEEGVKKTKEYLARADVAFFDEHQPLDIEFSGVPFTFITFNQFSPLSLTTMINHSSTAVREAREEGRVPIVFAHWGEEYAPANENQREIARQFVDAGAALIIGSHPHIVQEVERYREKYIYYSLGNFIFDQYFNEEVQNGLLLSVTVTKDGVQSIQEIPIRLHPDGRTCVADPVER